MRKTVREAINTIATMVRQVFDIEVPIQNMASVVTNLGGRIEESNDLSLVADGAVKKEGENGFVICVPKDQIETRRNFTVAHEIGHLFLHMGYKVNEALWAEQDENPYYRKGTTEDEYQANEFAAAFLMPEEEYGQKLRELTTDGMVNIHEVADYFNVSVEAATNRGKFLGYLDW